MLPMGEIIWAENQIFLWPHPQNLKQLMEFCNTDTECTLWFKLMNNATKSVTRYENMIIGIWKSYSMSQSLNKCPMQFYVRYVLYAGDPLGVPIDTRYTDYTLYTVKFVRTISTCSTIGNSAKSDFRRSHLCTNHPVFAVNLISLKNGFRLRN